MTKGKENKPHIGIFGRRNFGKSSLINLLAGQDIAIVSDIAGTTTDPVKKSVEVHGIGPVIFVDTAGIDDTGELGALRVSKTLKSLDVIDMAILVIAENYFGHFEEQLIDKFNFYEIPYIVIHNKSDIQTINKNTADTVFQKAQKTAISFCSRTAGSIEVEELVKAIRETMPATAWKKPSLLGDLLNYGDIVLLITPIDIEAPEGRMILPQVQAIRDILDNDCVAIVLKEREVDQFLKHTHIKPKLAITDSQVFLKADASIPKDIALTSFSIMLARQKGDFFRYIEGTPKISELKDNDRVLVLESCTHHVSCDDIGRVKIPRWIGNFTGKNLHYDTVAGLDQLPRAIDEYALVIQCGGCMITKKQLHNRLKPAIDKNIPVTNYGMAIAYVQGIFERAVAPFLKSALKSDNYL
ncbi:MAG: [FeFe] hydrogenase H-cluster maturation GTPase HydF [Bacteroidales bacterium]|nr:[FeFe] hydrogenase H-cluster maturation GTPase HydF [Bacteroidales bacterium]